MDNKEQRARELIGRGVSRRALDRALREEFGSSIGHEKHGKLYVELARRERSDLVTAVSPRLREEKTLRSKRYNRLVRQHFTHEEAMELSKLKLDHPELKVMVRQRASLWGSFVYRVRVRGVDPKRAKGEWRDMVYQWYKRRKLLTKGWLGKQKGLISPWDWRDKVRKSIPKDQLVYRGGSARGHWKPIVSKSPASSIARVSREIDRLKQMLSASPDVRERERLSREIGIMRADIRLLKAEGKL